MLLVLLHSCPVEAQDLEPHALSPAPVGMSFFVLGYSYSEGNVLLDLALPLEGTEARLHAMTAGYARAINVFGHSGRFSAAVPFAEATWTGELGGQTASTQRTGLGDPLIAFAVNFLGSPALRRAEFKAHRHNTIVGTSLRLRLPLGQYDSSKFFNLGTGRWMLSPRLAVARHVGRFSVEGYLSGWLFTTNTNFFGGNKVAQDPLLALQLHLSYQFRPGFWGAVSAGRSFGGETEVNGVAQDNEQTNNRLGATVAIPLTRAHSVKVALTSGVSTRVGADFDTLVIAWQYRWGGVE